MGSLQLLLRQSFSLACLALLLCASVWAQVAGVATAQGVVTDNSGAVVANAQVTITNLDTGVALNTTSNEDGLYRLTGLSPGRYNIEAKAGGFAPTRINDARLEVGQTARFDIALKPGNVSETVEVSAQMALLNSETTDVGQVIDGKRIVETPLNGRNYLQLAQLTAGGLPAGKSRPTQERGLLAVRQTTIPNNRRHAGT